MSKILFLGTPDFAVPALEALIKSSKFTVGAVITQPDKPAGRGGALTSPPVKRVATANGIPVFQPQSIRKDWNTLRPNLEKLGPFDIGIVVAFGQILPTEVLTFPRCGCLNIHASILPRWRGAAPIQRAIEAGDPETGVCLMKMEEGLDTGPVFAETRTKITHHDTAASLHDTLSLMGAQLLIERLPDILAANLQPTLQSDTGITYAKKIVNSESVISWQLSAQELSLKIRAFSPYPGCYTTWHGKRLKVLAAHQVQQLPPELSNHIPGSVVRATADQLVVACASSSLLSLDEVQLEGKKRMSISEFLRGTQIVPGATLGSPLEPHQKPPSELS